MKRRVTVSIIICVVFVLLTSSIAVLLNYISTGGHPGINTESFAPAVIKKVPDEEDIAVRVYPTGGLFPHGYDRDDEHYVRLNNIEKGWIITLYQGNCRLLFEINDSEMEDFCGIGNKKHYYYAEMIPRQRLRVTDITARLKEEPEAPSEHNYFDCCIREEIARYRFPRKTGLFLAAVNIIFILLAAGINLIIRAFQKIH